jgi:hypothetical protein
MDILLFGATGMVGSGVLRWLIASPKVSRVVAVSRKPLAIQHPKLETVIEPDMFHLQHLSTLRDLDACFFCLGASSVGMSQEDYRRLTYEQEACFRRVDPLNLRNLFLPRKQGSPEWGGPVPQGQHIGAGRPQQALAVEFRLRAKASTRKR